jgi:pimeloyl-ACP methyl ester carboxylesterase
VCFSHGKESGPWGTKITRLAEVARHRGFDVVSIDYRHTLDPHERVEHLIKQQLQTTRLILVGSSMGGYVAAQACEALKPLALFLMAPALYFPGWDEAPQGLPSHTTVVHGWHDDIVPVDVALRLASEHAATLHVLGAGHTLNERLDQLDRLFDDFLLGLPPN